MRPGMCSVGAAQTPSPSSRDEAARLTPRGAVSANLGAGGFPAAGTADAAAAEKLAKDQAAEQAKAEKVAAKEKEASAAAAKAGDGDAAMAIFEAGASAATVIALAARDGAYDSALRLLARAYSALVEPAMPHPQPLQPLSEPAAIGVGG